MVHGKWNRMAEIGNIEAEIGKRSQLALLEKVIEYQPSLVNQLMILFRKQLHSTNKLEINLAVRGFCILFSSMSNTQENQKEFILIINYSLSLPILQRKIVYECLGEFLFNFKKNKNNSFFISILPEIVDIFYNRLKRYFIDLSSVHDHLSNESNILPSTTLSTSVLSTPKSTPSPIIPSSSSSFSSELLQRRNLLNKIKLFQKQIHYILSMRLSFDCISDKNNFDLREREIFDRLIFCIYQLKRFIDSQNEFLLDQRFSKEKNQDVEIIVSQNEEDNEENFNYIKDKYYSNFPKILKDIETQILSASLLQYLLYTPAEEEENNILDAHLEVPVKNSMVLFSNRVDILLQFYEIFIASHPVNEIYNHYILESHELSNPTTSNENALEFSSLQKSWLFSDFEIQPENQNYLLFFDSYIILIYLKYHSNPKCKWNSNWNEYFAEDYIKQTLISIPVAFSMLRMYFNSQEDNYNISLLLVQFLIDIIQFKLEFYNNYVYFTDIFNELIEYFYKSATHIETQQKNFSNLVNINKLNQIISKDYVDYQKFLLHSTSLDVIVDIKENINCSILRLICLFIKSLHKTENDKLLQLFTKYYEIYETNRTTLEDVTWLDLSLFLAKQLQREFEQGITPLTVNTYLNAIETTYHATLYTATQSDTNPESQRNILSTLPNKDKFVKIIEQITNIFVDILRAYSITDHELLNQILQFLININELHKKLELIRLLSQSSLNRSTVDESNNELLLIRENTKCMNCSLNLILTFYKSMIKPKTAVPQHTFKAILSDTFTFVSYVIHQRTYLLIMRKRTKLLGNFLSLIHSLFLKLKLVFSSLMRNRKDVCEFTFNTRKVTVPEDFTCETLFDFFHCSVDFYANTCAWVSKHREELGATSQLLSLLWQKEYFATEFRQVLENLAKKSKLSEYQRAHVEKILLDTNKNYPLVNDSPLQRSRHGLAKPVISFSNFLFVELFCLPFVPRRDAVKFVVKIHL